MAWNHEPLLAVIYSHVCNLQISVLQHKIAEFIRCIEKLFYIHGAISKDLNKYGHLFGVGVE